MPPDFSIENKIKFSLGRQNENRRRATDKEGIQKVESIFSMILISLTANLIPFSVRGLEIGQ